jgi:N-succinyldiaminopimelate aminotransferase
VVLIPNPFYQAYGAAAAASGAEPIFLPSTAATDFLPELDKIDMALLERAVALYVNSPSNPQGAVAGSDYLARAIAVARRFDFLLFADECYSEIYSALSDARASHCIHPGKAHTRGNQSVP